MRYCALALIVLGNNVCNLFSSQTIALLYQVATSFKEFALIEAQLPYQAPKGFRMALQSAIREDVLNFDGPSDQVARDENAAVAGEGILLRAEECDAVMLGTPANALQTFPEKRGVCERAVLNFAGSVATRVLAACAEFAPEKDIANSSLL